MASHDVRVPERPEAAPTESLLAALRELSAALESGRADAVAAVEPRLAAAVNDVGCRFASGVARETTPDVVSGVAAVRQELAACRRLGGTVPALMSVMFPGRGLYGRDGRSRV